MNKAQVVVLVLSLVSSVCCRACLEQQDANVLILGAGLAGLGAAETLSNNGIDSFLIIEALDRIGGRVQSKSFGGGTIELGPQWMFSLDFTTTEERLHPFIPILDVCNVSVRTAPLGTLPIKSYNNMGEDITDQVGEALLQYSQALAPDIIENIVGVLPEDADIPLHQGLRVGGWLPISSIEEHVEAIRIDAAFGRPSDATGYKNVLDPQVFFEHAFQFGNEPLNLVVTNSEGYSAVPQCIADQFLTENDPRLLLKTVVRGVSWGDECICAMTDDEKTYCAPYAIMTFSVGELQAGGVKFTPDLPFIKQVTLNQFDLSFFLKIYISFNDTFWDTGVEFITYNDEINGREYYPFFIPWGSFFPERPHILEAILTGETAKRVAYQDLEITRQQITEVMQNIYGEKATDPIDIIMHDFIVNPYFYGDFTAPVPGLTRRQFDEINIPCGNLYFSGEAYSYLTTATAHGALLHGRETAERVVAELQSPLRGSSGQVSYTDLDDGEYLLRVIARDADGEIVRTTRSFTINTNASRCNAHLINTGISVHDSRAVVEFTSTGLPPSGFQCRIDALSEQACSSPFILRRLSAGRHRLRIIPTCDGTQGRRIVFIHI